MELQKALEVQKRLKEAREVTNDPARWGADARFLLVFQPTKAGRDLVAFVHLRFENEAGAAVLYIYEIQLKDCVQRKGLGKFLMQLVELIGRKRGMEALMLTVLEVSEGAVKFYSQLGFKTDASSPGVEDWEDGRPPGYRILSKSINDPRKAQPVLRDANGGAALAAHASVPAAASS